VVVKDVPANCVVVGIPARIIKRDGVKVDEKL
jgi:serine O-acetyltransferase